MTSTSLSTQVTQHAALYMAGRKLRTMEDSAGHFSNRFYHTGRKFHGPVKVLNPTTAYFPILQKEGEEGYGHPQQQPATAWHVWRSRDNRKGRHAAVVNKDHLESGAVGPLQPTNTWNGVVRGIWKMLVKYPVWDVSYDVAIVFTLGSIIWCFNGFFVWLPLEAPSSEFKNEVLWGGGITGFVGATVFEIGSVLLMLEAVNENRTDCFGWALERSIEGEGLHLLPKPRQTCAHHHHIKHSFLKPSREVLEGSPSQAQGDPDTTETGRKWSWWPSWHELRTHYFREIGFLACLSQFWGATIFWIAGICGLPPIYEKLHGPSLNGAYWAPQVIGGSGFIISSWLFMLEVQKKWYLPNLTSLGWHMGFWNLVGAIGFTLCGALGFAGQKTSIEYAGTLSTFIGSWAFLIGSLVQWYESLSKYPIVAVKNGTFVEGSQSAISKSKDLSS